MSGTSIEKSFVPLLCAKSNPHLHAGRHKIVFCSRSRDTYITSTLFIPTSPLKLSDQKSPFNITKPNMSAGLPSDEVAEDYKNSLEDLTMNSKYEISNLTVIAKENTEHGMAISRVLEKHIRDVSGENLYVEVKGTRSGTFGSMMAVLQALYLTLKSANTWIDTTGP